MIVTELFFVVFLIYVKTRKLRIQSTVSTESHFLTERTGIYVSGEHKPLTSRYYFHHLNGFWLNSSPPYLFSSW